MKIKKFRAADSQAAMQQIRRELGDDAAIVGCYQVGEGVEYLVVDDRVEPPARRQEIDDSETGGQHMRALQQEMGAMRQLLERHLRRLGGRQPAAVDARVATETLRQLELDESVAAELLARLPTATDEGTQQRLLQQLLLDQLGTASPTVDGALALIGLPGAGKTTLVAKMAAQAVLAGERDRIGLISLDDQRAGAGEQLRGIGRILKVPVLLAQSPEELQQALLAFRDKTRILIDTPALHPRDSASLLRLQQRLALVPGLTTWLVAAADQDWRLPRAALQAMTQIETQAAVISRTDLALSLGGVLSLLYGTRLPLAGTSAGAGLATGLQPAQPAALLAQALALTASEAGEPAADHPVEEATNQIRCA